MRTRWLVPAVLALSMGCGSDPALPVEGALFVLEVSGEEFRALVTDQDAVVALEARRAEGTEGVVSGTLAPGDGGFNGPWSWHWDPGSVHVADLSAEVCDGRPSMVEDDLSYWLGTVKQFCPWRARVVRRER